MLSYKTHFINHQKSWIVFIHGAGGSRDTWKRQWRFFEKEFNLLALDLRDHGDSKNILPQRKKYDFELISEDILEVLDDLKIVKAQFISLSFGSVLLQHLSMKRPEIIEKAVMAGGVFSGSILIKIFVHSAKFLNFFFSYPTMYRLFSKLLMPRKAHQKSRKIYQKHAEKISKSEYLKWLGLYSSFFLTLKRFYNHPVQFPSLVVMGAQDYVFLSAARRYSSKHSEVTFQILEDSGHICNIDNHLQFNKVTHQFLCGG